MMKTKLILLVLTFISISFAKAQTLWDLTSPNGSLKISLALEQGSLFYSVSIYDNSTFKSVITKSPLGIVREDGDFTESLAFDKVGSLKAVNETFRVQSGKALQLNNSANELEVTFKNTGQQLITIVLRAYDDGIAFRYLFPEQKEGDFSITKELTGFGFSDGKAWMIPYDDVTKWTPAYEADYNNGIAIGADSPKKNGWCFPALFHTNDIWVLLTEAGLEGSFYGAHLNAESKDGMYTIRFPEKEESQGVYGQHATSTSLPWATPWRLAVIGNDLNTIVSSNLVKFLSPKSKIKDTSWIKPGRVSWSWLTDHDSPKDYDKLKQFVDLSAHMGWEYSLVDANWNAMKGGNIEQLIDYANAKKVGLFLWYNSGGPHNDVSEELRDLMHLKETRVAEFKKLAEWGIKGIKIDFFQSDKPGMMQLYQDILEDAAKYQLLVNFHGSTIPRGWSRTYPNLLSMEAVRGGECYTFSEVFTENAPINNTILPVT
ncbi:MAG: glycoside hydrolase family 97 N-terminal domain-containing protein, partial [Bacteroidota bacterium]